MSEDLGRVTGYSYTLYIHGNDGKRISKERIEVKL